MKTATVKVLDDYMPSLQLTSKMLPEIKAWRVGGRYRVLLELEQTSQTPDKVNAGFHILNVHVVPTTHSKEAILEVMAKKAKD